MEPTTNTALRAQKSSRVWWLPLDGVLLLLLLGVTQNLLWIKLLTIAFTLAYLLIRKERFMRPLPSPFYFFVLTPLAGLLSALLMGSFQFKAYPFVALYGCLQWLAGGFAFLLLFLRLQRTNALAANNSLQAFMVINFIASLIYLALTMRQSGSWWPYTLVHDTLFGPSTGDYIKGVFGASSLVNAACSALLLLFFTGNKAYRWAALGAVTLWLSGSNLIFLLCLVLLIAQLIVAKKQRGWQIAFVLFFVAGYLLTNFYNVRYLVQVGSQLRGVTGNPSTQKSHPATPPPYQIFQWNPEAVREWNSPQGNKASDIASGAAHDKSSAAGTANGPLPDTTLVQQTVRQLYGCSYQELPPAFAGMPLKAFAVRQTLLYDVAHPKNIWLGAGMGNASSKLAVKVTSWGWQGRWPANKAYIGNAFYQTHLQDLLYMYSQEPSVHSIINFPNNTYLQLFGEYGLAGLLLFVGCYLRFFWKKMKKNLLLYGPLLLLLLLLLATDYWLESITVTFVFETLLLLPRSERKNTAATP